MELQFYMVEIINLTKILVKLIGYCITSFSSSQSSDLFFSNNSCLGKYLRKFVKHTKTWYIWF